MTNKTVTFNTLNHKIVPIEPTEEWIKNLIKRNGEPSSYLPVEVMHTLINELLASAPEYQECSQWVSVNERLPEIDTPVLAVVGKNVYALARVEYEEGWLWGIGGNDLSDARNYEADDDYQPTHWMYLSIPPAPKGDKP